MPAWSGNPLLLIPGSRCPACGSPMEYDGNYWCSSVDCDWVLPEEASPAEHKAFKVAYVLLMRQRGEEPDVSVVS